MDEQQQLDNFPCKNGRISPVVVTPTLKEEEIAENDENESCASTEATHGDANFTGTNINDNENGGRKRVRLAPHHEVVALVEDMSETERDNTWWRQEDFDDTKANVKQMCRGLRKQRRFSNCLTDAYERACGMNMTDAGDTDAAAVVDDTISAAGLAASTRLGHGLDGLGCMGSLIHSQGSSAGATIRLSDGSDSQKSMEELRNDPEFSNLFDDDGPRGLERLSSRLHAMRRQRHLQEVKHAVFLEQARQNIANQRNSELLARQAEFASRKSRAFASLLGMGDAWAVADLQQEDDIVVEASGEVDGGSSSKMPSVETVTRISAATATTALQGEEDRSKCAERANNPAFMPTRTEGFCSRPEHRTAFYNS